jgi:hypothetical protein
MLTTKRFSTSLSDGWISNLSNTGTESTMLHEHYFKLQYRASIFASFLQLVKVQFILELVENIKSLQNRTSLVDIPRTEHVK